MGKRRARGTKRDTEPVATRHVGTQQAASEQQAREPGSGLSLETPAELFADLVSEAVASQRNRPSDASADYLVQLLEAFVCPSQLHERTDTRPDRPVAEIFCHALGAAGMRRLALLKLAGDLSLFIVGVIPESLKRRPVGIDYYRRLGGTAYATAAGDCHSPDTADLFAQLARQFVLLADVLQAVCERCALAERPDLLRFHQRWLEIRSPRAAQVLARHGVVLDTDAGSVN